MSAVFLVSHLRQDPDGSEDVKLIGVYSSEAMAKAAVERHRELPGFRESVAGFDISKYQVDKDYWSEGFRGDAGRAGERG